MIARPRIAPLSPPYSPEVEASLRKWMPTTSVVEPLALFRTLARHPQLSERLRHLGAFFLGRSALPLRTRELVILRTCARCGAEYEWGVHVAAFAASAGLDDHAIDATLREPPAGGSDFDDLTLRAVDELHDQNTLTEPTWSELRAVIDDEMLLELVALVGFYHLVSFLVRAIDLEPESWAARFPAAAAERLSPTAQCENERLVEG